MMGFSRKTAKLPFAEIREKSSGSHFVSSTQEITDKSGLLKITADHTPPERTDIKERGEETRRSYKCEDTELSHT